MGGGGKGSIEFHFPVAVPFISSLYFDLPFYSFKNIQKSSVHKLFRFEVCIKYCVS